MNLDLKRIALSLRRATLHFGPVAVEAAQYDELLEFARTNGFDTARDGKSLSHPAWSAFSTLPNFPEISEQAVARRWHTVWEKVGETPQGKAFLDTILHSSEAAAVDLAAAPDYTLYHTIATGHYNAGSLDDLLKIASNPAASLKTLKLLLSKASGDLASPAPLLTAIAVNPNADEQLKATIQRILAPPAAPKISPAKMRSEAQKSRDPAWLQATAESETAYDGELMANPHLSGETIELLWQRNVGNYRLTFLVANPAVSLEFLQAHSDVGDPKLKEKLQAEIAYRTGLAGLSPKTQALWQKAQTASTDAVATKLIKQTDDPQLLGMALRGQLKWPEAHVALANPMCPPEAVADALEIGPQEKDYNIFDRFVALAENPSVTLATLLGALVKRKLVLAEHYAKTLFELFEKKSPSEQQLALMYKISPAAYLNTGLPRPDAVFAKMRLAKDDDSRWAVLEDARATAEDYVAFMRKGKLEGWSSFQKVQQLLAANQNLPPEFIAWLRTQYASETKFWQIYDMVPQALTKEEMVNKGFRGKDSFDHQALPVDAKVPGYELSAKGTSWVRYIDAQDQANEFPPELFRKFNLHSTPTKNGKPLGWIGGKWDAGTETLYVTEMQSDLLQRTQELNKPVFEKWRPLRSRLENRFGSWYYTFFNQALREAQARGAKQVAIPTAAAYAKAVPGAKGIAPIYEKILAAYPHETKGPWNYVTLGPTTRIAMKRSAERNEYTQLEVDTWASHAAIFIKKMVPNAGYVNPSEKEHAFDELKSESREHLDLTDEAYGRFWDEVKTKLISDGVLEGSGETIDRPRDQGPDNREELGLSKPTEQNKNRRKNGPDDPELKGVPGVAKVSPHDVFNAPDLGDRIMDMWDEYKKTGDPEVLKVITQWSKHIGSCTVNQLDRRCARRREAKALGDVRPLGRVMERKAISDSTDEASVKRYMEQLVRSEDVDDDPTYLAEQAAQHFGHPEWLDEEVHFVWELAQQVVTKTTQDPLLGTHKYSYPDNRADRMEGRDAQRKGQSAAMNPPAQNSYGSTPTATTAPAAPVPALGGKVPPPKPTTPVPPGKKLILDPEQNTWVLADQSSLTPT